MTATPISDVFQPLIERLLGGEIVCRVTSEEQYDYLQDPQNREGVDSYLRRIGRTLRCTQDGMGYFVAYKDIDDTTAKRHIRRRFSETVNDIEPFIRLLRLIGLSNRTDRPLQHGDVIHAGDLAKAVDQAPALVKELESLSRSRLFGNQATGAARQIEAILKKLNEYGYLEKTGASGAKYVATGKWSRLYEELQFIASREHLDTEEDAPEQQELVE